jgi:uncharacterized protein
MSKKAASHADNRLARHAHVSYIEIPAPDGKKSAAFYEAVFGWKIAFNKPDSPSFDDLSGDVIGRFSPTRNVSRDPGVMPYIYVVGIDRIVASIVKHGGEIVKQPYPEGDLWVATFRDIAGNLMGIWQFGPR